MKTLIIAEIGVNHNGDRDLMKRLVEMAGRAKSDVAKFQTFSADYLVNPDARKAPYQLGSSADSQTQYEMLKSLELTESDHLDIIRWCNEGNIEFLSTAFDIRSLELLISMGMQRIKIPSGEITNLRLLEMAGQLNKKIIMSTGMCTMNEVEEAMNALVKSGANLDLITLLQCTSCYPTPKNEVNLRAMLSMRDHFGVSVGLSDHTEGIEISLAAVAMGATIIEKHITLSRSMLGPDHKVSLEEGELTLMVNQIRNIEEALGSDIKVPSPCELENITSSRKSLVASRSIVQGEIFTDENIMAMRPAGGISPMHLNNIIGTAAKRRFSQFEAIEL